MPRGILELVDVDLDPTELPVGDLAQADGPALAVSAGDVQGDAFLCSAGRCHGLRTPDVCVLRKIADAGRFTKCGSSIASAVLPDWA